MTRNEYFNQLNSALMEFDEETRNEILSDYTEHFDTGLRSGKSEADICRDLGPVNEIVNELRMLQNTYSEAGSSFCEESGSALTAFSQSTSGNSSSDNNSSESSSTESSDFSADKNNSTEENSSQNDYSSEGASNGSSQFSFGTRQVIVDGLCATVIVQKSRDGRINFNYKNYGSDSQRQQYEFVHNDDGNTIRASVVDHGSTFKWYQNKRTCPQIDLFVDIPEGMNLVQIKTINSDIRLTDCYANRIQAESLSGDISIYDSRANIIDERSKSGDLSAEKITVNYLTLNTLSGDAKVKNVLAQNIGCSTASGDVKVEECKSENTAASSMSGDVFIDRGEYRSISSDSKSGDIHFTADAVISNNKSISGNVDINVNNASEISAKSTSGDVHVYIANCTGINADIHTVSGSGKCCFRNECFPSKTGTFRLGDGSVLVRCSSVSGNIRIDA